MLRYAPSRIFNNIASRPDSGVGIFTSEEKLTIFPQFASFRDRPNCEGKPLKKVKPHNYCTPIVSLNS
jgi:hypothetical protein